jgi:hypothetical protein
MESGSWLHISEEFSMFPSFLMLKSDCSAEIWDDQSFLINFGFTSRSRIFHFMETPPLPVKGFKILAYARRSRPLSREGSLS